MTDNTAYLQQIQTEYQSILAKQEPGDEPEEKGKLRLLAKQMGYGALRLDFERWLEDCLDQADWQGLCNLLIQESKRELIPSPYGGYLYERNFWILLDAFAGGDPQMIERGLPRDLLPIQDHNTLLFRVMNDLLMAVWYEDEERLAQAIPFAEQFLTRKTASGWDKAIVSYLLALYREDMEEASQTLLAVCKGFSRSKCYWLAKKRLCTNAHGLYCLAQLYLEKRGRTELFEKLQMPKYKNFSREFALWRIEHLYPEHTLYFRYPEELTWLNPIYEIPPAKLLKEESCCGCRGMEMQRRFVEEVWEYQISNGHVYL